jgi:AcrR family transcriptional regulator
MADYRFQRTDNEIQAAFLKLVNQQGFRNVSVSAVTQAALINRQTFYQHYTDIYDLSEKMVDHMMLKFKTLLEIRGQKDALKLGITEMKELISPQATQLFFDERDKIKILRQLPLDEKSLDKQLTKTINQYLDAFFKEEISALERELLTAIVFTGINYILAEKKFPNVQQIKRSFEDMNRLFS